MNAVIKKLLDGLAYLFYPNYCVGCAGDLPDAADYLCINCHYNWPRTQFEHHSINPVEKIFRGRVLLQEAMAYCYFKKGTGVQSLIHLLKYKHEKRAAIPMGAMMATALKSSDLYQHVDLLVPVPMFVRKEKSRGYNQAALLANAIGKYWAGQPVCMALRKTTATSSQTYKSRWQRKLNMEGRYELDIATNIAHKHILLIDDVITTGATLEACALALEQGNPASISVSSFAWTAGNFL